MCNSMFQSSQSYAEGVSLHSPGLAGLPGYPGWTSPRRASTLKGLHRTVSKLSIRSIPNITLVVFNAVFLEQPPKLILK